MLHLSFKLIVYISSAVAQDVGERVKRLSPKMMEDFVKPYQIDIDEVFFIL